MTESDFLNMKERLSEYVIQIKQHQFDSIFCHQTLTDHILNKISTNQTFIFIGQPTGFLKTIFEGEKSKKNGILITLLKSLLEKEYIREIYISIFCVYNNQEFDLVSKINGRKKFNSIFDKIGFKDIMRTAKSNLK